MDTLAGESCFLRDLSQRQILVIVEFHHCLLACAQKLPVVVEVKTNIRMGGFF